MSADMSHLSVLHIQHRHWFKSLNSQRLYYQSLGVPLDCSCCLKCPLLLISRRIHFSQFSHLSANSVILHLFFWIQFLLKCIFHCDHLHSLRCQLMRLSFPTLFLLFHSCPPVSWPPLTENNSSHVSQPFPLYLCALVLNPVPRTHHPDADDTLLGLLAPTCPHTYKHTANASFQVASELNRLTSQTFPTSWALADD